MERPAILAKEQLSALDRLSAWARGGEFYLAGGSALAIRLGHRRSLDLDFFSRDRTADLARVRRTLDSSFTDVRVIGETDVVLRVECDGARLDFVVYPYAPLEEPAAAWRGVRVAGLRDLGTMKLAAIARRGIRRDFWDLHAILQAGVDFRALGSDYLTRFGVAASDLYHVARALTYFDDAEKDPALPAGMTPDGWEAIKRFFTERGPDLLPLERP